MKSRGTCVAAARSAMWTMVAAFAVIATFTVSTWASDDGWAVRPGCVPDCASYHVSGSVYTPQHPVVASPTGSTYSITHRVGVDPDGEGPDPAICVSIFNPTFPGVPDDIVKFDGRSEPLRTDLLGTVPWVVESTTINADNTYLIVIDSSSDAGTDLFPGGFVWGPDQIPLTDACFTIGLDDALDWPGVDNIHGASITLSIGNQPVVGPLDITGLFSAPWDGLLDLVVSDAAGQGINHVRLDIVAAKEVDVPNDNCADAISIGGGFTAFSNIGATDDWPDEEIPECSEFGYDQIESDIWYSYIADCTGDLTVSLCDSAYDTKVAVYTGCGRCSPGQSPTACNDDATFCGPFGDQSKVTLQADQGMCYTIRIGGYRGEQGLGQMRISCAPGACCVEGECTDNVSQADCVSQGGTWIGGQPCSNVTCPAGAPPNDECADCIALNTGVPYDGTTDGAGGADISRCGLADTVDVWHSWTADCCCRATFSLCDSAYDTTLAVFDGCDGAELGCGDDNCAGTRSKIVLSVTAGTTYYARVSGHNGATGDYTIEVEPCAEETMACCSPADYPPGACFPVTPQVCLNASGTPMGPGTTCLGDHNANGRDDACETCPTATIVEATPPSGTVDARQPHDQAAALPRQGIGAPGEAGAVREPIVVVLDPAVSTAEGCFRLCETAEDPLLGPNDISSVTYLGEGQYEIMLDRAITAHAITTIEYTGDGSFVEYISHPANVNADSAAAPSDILELIDCCLNGTCTPRWGAYSCDLDRSGAVLPADILGVVDLLNGAGEFDPWNDSTLPDNVSCP